MLNLNFGGGGGPFNASGVDSDEMAGNSLAAPQVSATVALNERILRNATVLEPLKIKVEAGRRLDVFRAVSNQVP